MKKWLLLIFSVLCCLTLYASGLFNQPVNTQTLNVIGKKQIGSSHEPLSRQAANLASPVTSVGTVPSAVKTQGNASTPSTDSQSNNFTVSNSQANQPKTILTQEQVLYADKQIQVLKQTLASLSSKIKGLSSAYATLNVQVQQMKLQLDSVHNQSKSTPLQLGVWQGFGHYVSSFPATILLAVIILLLLVILYFILMPKKTFSTVSVASPQEIDNAPDDQDTEQEYDFMGSKEGVPAKIDLARAYVAMQDYQQAKQVLDDVLTKGNNEQRQAAQIILDSIPGDK